MIRTFYNIDHGPVLFNVDRRMVGDDLYVIFTAAELDPASFPDVTHNIRTAVLCHLLMWPTDKYLARFVVGEHVNADDECWHEVQFKDREGLNYPTWQRMVVSPYLNSRDCDIREAA